MEQKTELESKAPPEEVQRVVKEFTRQTNISSEYSGTAGQYVRNQSERLGISPKLIRALRGMERMDDAKRQAWIREQIYGWLAMGYFTQVDAFDDLGTYLKKILSDISATPPEPEQTEAPKTGRKSSKKADPVLESLTSTAH